MIQLLVTQGVELFDMVVLHSAQNHQNPSTLHLNFSSHLQLLAVQNALNAGLRDPKVERPPERVSAQRVAVADKYHLRHLSLIDNGRMIS